MQIIIQEIYKIHKVKLNHQIIVKEQLKNNNSNSFIRSLIRVNLRIKINNNI